MFELWLGQRQAANLKFGPAHILTRWLTLTDREKGRTENWGSEIQLFPILESTNQRFARTPWCMMNNKIINNLNYWYSKWKFKKYTRSKCESLNEVFSKPFVYKSPHDNWLHLIQTPHSSYHCTSMSLRPGPWKLRFLIVDKETDVLSYLTSNGVDNAVTIESKEEPSKQTVRLDIISVCITDGPHYSGSLSP